MGKKSRQKMNHSPNAGTPARPPAAPAGKQNMVFYALLAMVVALVAALAFVGVQRITTERAEKRLLAKKAKKHSKRKHAANADNLPMPLDVATLPDDFPAAMKKIHEALRWDAHKDAIASEIPTGAADVQPYMKLAVNRDILTKSLDLGAGFMIRNQKPDGSFNYMYDWLTRTWVPDDNQVRQAGALWGIAICHRYKPSAEAKAALLKGFKYWFDNTVPGPDNTLTVKYQEEKETQTGTVALINLAIVDYLSTEKNIPAEFKKQLTDHLEGYFAYLQKMQRRDGLFAKAYYLDEQRPTEKTSPYFNGETLLSMCKAARQLNYTNLVPTIERAARSMAETYTVKAWKEEADSAETKGAYQWSSMSFAEYYEAKWKDYELLGDTTLALAWWMIHTHNILTRTRNHAYAQEGLIAAYRIAKARADVPAMVDILYTIDRSFHKLTSWQIGGPLPDVNEFLKEHKTDDPVAYGGIMNAPKAYPDEPPKHGDTRHELRIDVTQHQMHAVTMALRYVYLQPNAVVTPGSWSGHRASSGEGGTRAESRKKAPASEDEEEPAAPRRTKKAAENEEEEAAPPE
jgi:hypothetical protein